MLTDSAQQTTARPGLLARAGDQLRQFICGLGGHDELRHFEKGRMSLHCVSCGYESPGWDVRRTPAREETAATAPARPRIVRMPLARERRAA